MFCILSCIYVRIIQGPPERQCPSLPCAIPQVTCYYCEKDIYVSSVYARCLLLCYSLVSPRFYCSFKVRNSKFICVPISLCLHLLCSNRVHINFGYLAQYLIENRHLILFLNWINCIFKYNMLLITQGHILCVERCVLKVTKMLTHLITWQWHKALVYSDLGIYLVICIKWPLI